MRRKYHTYLSPSFLENLISREFLMKAGGVAIIGGVLSLFVIWAFFLRGVPDVSSIERGDYFRESTVIYDKEKQPIYTLFNDGKRTYMKYTDISDSIKNAIISTEDKTFFENPGFDVKGLIRAGLNYVTGKTDKIKGTSTLSQQLISYTLLTKERSIKRKVQEAYLSYKLNKNYSKEKILEMYLNAISFGYNANGVEEASKTYFGKSAKEVGPLGASILASLPKGPTYYSPYLHRDRLMGKVYVYPLSDPSQTITIDTPESRTAYKGLYTEFRNYLSGMTLKSDGAGVEICGLEEKYMRNDAYFPGRDGCSSIGYDDLLLFFGDIRIEGDITNSGSTERYGIEYSIGRKDFVASRMLEDGSIDGETFHKIISDGIEFEFKKYSENIRYPYFVMYIKEYLETKYGKDIDITQGLKVYTTIDPKLQDKAEELVKKQVAINKAQYGASSAALVAMDNKSGGLLAMVGGPDYFDTEHGGNNNMTIAKRQPGSSFKPIVYALAISKNPIGPESPIADVSTKFGKWVPDNYDRGFKGIMPLKKALAYSRNIPAAKMFYLGGKEEEIVKYGKIFGLSTLREDAGYGAPMAIGTAEVRPIDLMQTYSVFANLGIKREVHAVERIEDSDGNVLEEYKAPEKEEPVFSPAASYIVTKILSDPESRPEGFWRNALTINGRNVAAKTGTSNKEISKEKILPRDLWTAGYSPQITTVVWAGNVNGKETKGSCDGLNCAAGIWKPFMEFALKDLPKEDWKKPDGVYSYTIAKLSGKLATDTTPEDQKVSTIMAVKLDEYDEGFGEKEVDTLCNGPVSPDTPPGAIGKILIPSAKPVIDGYDPAWTEGFFQAINGSASGSTFVMPTDKPCERPKDPGNVTLTIETTGVNSTLDTPGKKILRVSWDGNRMIKNITVTSENDTKTNTDFASGAKTNGEIRFSSDLQSGDHTFMITATDVYGFTYSENKTITVSGKPGENLGGNISNVTDPKITLTNPRPNSPKISLYAGDTFNLRFDIAVNTAEREVSVFLDDTSIQTSSVGDIFVIPVGTSGQSPGNHTIRIVLTDGNLKKTEKQVALSILPR